MPAEENKALVRRAWEEIFNQRNLWTPISEEEPIWGCARLRRVSSYGCFEASSLSESGSESRRR